MNEYFSEFSATILIVDDVSENLQLLCETLQSANSRILAVPNGKKALEIATQVLPDLILLDVMMADINGFEVCKRLKQNKPTADIPVIFITAKDDKKSIIKGLELGGMDYITKPFTKEEVLIRVNNHLRIKQLLTALQKNNQQLLESNERLQETIENWKQADKKCKQAKEALQIANESLSLISQQELERWGISSFIGKSNTIAQILTDIRKLQKTDTTNVLIEGESGTGKELVARAIHFGGTRAKKPFITVNCSAIPKDLAESCFFGHVVGAFTGATANRKGYFELANNGTLFLDEIGEMPISLQPKILRTLEDGHLTPLGGHQSKKVNVRIIAVTNIRLKEKITEQLFRQDLYFRLARFTVFLPPLRDRKEDIQLFLDHFLTLLARDMGQKKAELTTCSQSALKNYHFPGNIRELKNIIEYAMIKSNGTLIEFDHLNFIQPPVNKSSIFKENSASPISEDEQGILAYIREHGRINNAQCRRLLNSDLHRASYLLKKMYRAGMLKREGSGRWSCYIIPSLG